ncbi:MAG: peptide chain release factor N(5)-glutamine methyltransferase [Flavobacteriaceae bacterium]|nr:peptide chain release factor N(5)-glutamine methyltransferase [Flavobacteriaceae bacterium]
MKIKDLKEKFVASIYELYPSEEVQSFFNLLSEKHLGMSRIEIALNSEKSISEENISKFEAATQRLKSFEPVQYIIGETEFYGLPFKVNKNVLIPRPETEELVSWVVESLEKRREWREKRVEKKESENYESKRLSASLHPDNYRDCEKILDIGTGSGCIPIVLASKLPEAEIIAVDISMEALEVAKQNASLNKVNIDFKKVDILNSDNWNLKFKNLEFNCIVSNPPYVRELEKELMEPNVVKYEPATALFVKDNDPLLFYRKIAQFGKEYLKPNGLLFFEINEYLGEKMLKLLKEEDYSEIEIKKDIFGKDRMLKCIKK